MNRKGRDFTVGDPGRQLLIFAWPLVLSMLLQNLYNMADTLIVGRYLGDTAMGAVGTCGSVTNVVLMLIGGCTQGMAVVLSQYIGAKDEIRVRKTITTGLYIIVGMAIVFGVIGMVFARELLMLINVSGEALDYAASYLVIIFAGSVATALYNMGNSMSRALGDSVTPMIVLIVTSILNIFLNILFVAGFHMGVPGVAYATILATILSAIVCWGIIWKKMPIVHPDKSTIRPDGEMAKLVIRIGLPSALQSSTVTIGILLVQALVNAFDTPLLPVMAAYAAATKIEAFISYPPGGISQGMQVLAGQNVGAGKFERVGRGLKASIKIIAVYSVFSAFVLITFGRFLMGFFTETPATVTIGYHYLVVTAIGVFFCGIVFTVRYTLSGSGDASAAVYISVIELAVRIGSAYVLSHFTPLGYIGVFLGTPMGWMVSGAYAVVRYRSGKWKKKRIVKENRESASANGGA